MFSKSKSGSRILENNPILNHYEVGRPYGSGGPEGIWKIYEGYSKTDKRVRLFYISRYMYLKRKIFIVSRCHFNFNLVSKLVSSSRFVDKVYVY